jgi:electron transfer flavoprotein alpha subunit
VAACLDVTPIADVIRIAASDVFERPIYAGCAIAVVQSSAPVKVLTVRPAAFTPAKRCERAAPIELRAALRSVDGVRVVSRETTRSDRPELASARIVVAGGRGLGGRENFLRHLEPLADRLGAALGASRAAIDARYIANRYQIGQTGTIVAPNLYIAVGISGAIQHLAGMKDARTIVAINSDPDAPIFAVADYGVVGDLNVIVPELIAALS